MNNFERIPIYFEKLDPDVKIPEYNHDDDAGMDIYSNEQVTIRPKETIAVKTGLKLEIPKGYEIQVRPRSGISLKTPMRVANAPGTIDSGYRGEIKVILTNTSCINEETLCYLKTEGNIQGKYTIKKGDKIAQIVLNKIDKMHLLEKDQVNVTERGEKGFGSSGI